MYAITGERALIEEFHSRSFKDGDEIFAHASEIFVVMAPLEGRWRNVGTILFRNAVIEEIFGVKWKCTKEFPTLDRKHFDGIRIISVVVVRHDIVLLGREDDEVNARSGESCQLFEVLATPKNNSLAWHKSGKQIDPSDKNLPAKPSCSVSPYTAPVRA
eukprot:CCRYP_013571-RA/>CCRYP_013571-RA protein AED:0.08 eAED:0.51 QI:0/0/0.5/1/0/0/2/365/158